MGITLKAARVNAGLTQKEAAERAHISINTLCNYETGKTYPTPPTIEVLRKIYKLRKNDQIDFF